LTLSQQFNHLRIHPLYFTSLKMKTDACLTETCRTLCTAKCNILVCILLVLLLYLICLFVWRLKVTNANFCNVQQLQTRKFAIHFAVTFFLEFKTANYLQPQKKCVHWLSVYSCVRAEYLQTTPRIAGTGGCTQGTDTRPMSCSLKMCGIFLPNVLWVVYSSYTHGEIPYGDLILQEHGANHMLFHEHRLQFRTS